MPLEADSSTDADIGMFYEYLSPTSAGASTVLTSSISPVLSWCFPVFSKQRNNTQSKVAKLRFCFLRRSLSSHEGERGCEHVDVAKSRRQHARRSDKSKPTLLCSFSLLVK